VRPRVCTPLFQRAWELAEKGNDADSIHLAKLAKDKINLLDDFERRHPEANGRDDPDDEDDEPFDVDEDDEDETWEGPFPDGPPGKLFSMFARACRSLGLDPEKVLDEAAAGKPFSFPTSGSRGAAQKKRK